MSDNTTENTNDDLVLTVAKAINKGLGEGWAYSNYHGDEWNTMRDSLLNAAREAIQAMQNTPSISSEEPESKPRI